MIGLHALIVTSCINYGNHGMETSSQHRLKLRPLLVVLLVLVLVVVLLVPLLVVLLVLCNGYTFSLQFSPWIPPCLLSFFFSFRLALAVKFGLVGFQAEEVGDACEWVVFPLILQPLRHVS